MTFGSKINFFKSCLIGVNVSREFMSMECNCTNCCEWNLPFNYLGLAVGANSKSMSRWQSLLEKLRRNIVSWWNH